MNFERDEIIFYHQLRNELYHSGNGMVPAVAHISGIRGAALWVFSTLFNVEAESLLTEHDTSSITPPVEEENADLSDQTKFLELFISMRHDLNMLMRIAGASESRGTTQIPVTEAWKNVFSSDVGEASERYEQVLKQAETLRDQIIEGKTSDSSDAKSRSLSHDLAEVSDFINAELRSHQREIVERAIEATSRAASPQGNRRAGIIWQTQGSGITLSAISYVTQALSIKELHNPTIIFATDMNVLVDQTYQRLVTSAQSFSSLAIRVSKTSELLNILRSDQKKIVFTTIQRLLSLKDEGPFERSNILFVGHNLHSTNEAISEVLPKAVFILFTSRFLPDDSKVVLTYGKLISKYDFRQAIEDNIVVPVNFEARHIKVSAELDPLLKDNQDGSWFFHLVSLDYIRALASDLVPHFESRVKDSMGKALIITPDRNTSSQLFSAIISLKPEWNNQSPTEGLIKVISAETHPDERRILLTRFEDPFDSFRLAITSGMWLTGLNSSALKTIYLLRPMSRNYLLQAMGGLTRNSLDKRTGLIVDYAENFDAFRSALEELDKWRPE